MSETTSPGCLTDKTGGLASHAAWLAAACAVGFYQLGISLLNMSVFPLFKPVFLEARDVGSLFSAALALVLYALLSKHPHLCQPRVWMAVAVGTYLLGVPTIFVGAWLANPVLLTLGVLLRSIASTWFGTTIVLQLTGLSMEKGTRHAFAALCAGWALSYAFELLVTALPLTAQLAVFLRRAPPSWCSRIGPLPRS